MGRDIFDSIDNRITKKIPKDNAAKILAINFNRVTVQMLRSKQIKSCLFATNKQANVGDTCTVEWVKELKGWAVTAVYAKGIAPASKPTSDSEFPPPQNIRALQSYPGAVVVQWDVTVNQPLAVEIQWNDTASESGATIESITRAGHAIIETTDDIYVRARSVDLDGERSDWTDWVLAEIGTGSAAITGFSYLGYNSIGGSQQTLGITWRTIYFKKISIAATSLLMSIGAYLKGSQIFPNPTYIQLQAMLMSDNAGDVGDLIAITGGINNHVMGVNPRWLDMPISKLMDPGDYWIGIRASGSASNNLSIYYDTGGSDLVHDAAEASASQTIDYPPFTTAWLTNSTYEYSIRAGVLS
jgi:hypothetical protein